MNRLLTKAELIFLITLAVIGLVVLPCLNAFVPKESFFHVSNFTIGLYGKYLCYAVLALSVDLLWGYMGLLSLGQALFFALGGYALGMHLMLMIGERGVYKTKLPDFMVFLEFPAKYPETGGLPMHWIPFHSFWFASAAIIWVPAVVALAFGFLAFRSRIKGVYFSILTQALTYAACLMFFRNDFTFGGNNGLTDFKEILGHSLNAPVTKRWLFISSVLLVLVTFLACRWITSTKFGKIQQAIRDSENRVLFSGYATANFKLFVFVIAAIIAGLGGALYVPQVGIINPSEMAPDKSLEAVVWVAVGGRGTLIGPILGAIGTNALKSYTTHAWPEYWLYILGGLFILVVVFMPKGLVGLPGQLRELKKKFTGPMMEKPSPRTEAAASTDVFQPAGRK
ncbi:MAG: urea ABC transporter permease subunit UrtC [Verrucomicrobiales bacterium]|nr:urea ABC transporter permease subunit UrtC [Verrucomicrobiales bacterium]